jgi:hypothetical protein
LHVGVGARAQIGEMMDPVSLGGVAAALLFKSVLEGMGTESGKSAWSALVTFLRTRLGRDVPIDRVTAGTASKEEVAALAEKINALSQVDSGFRSDLNRLVEHVRAETGGTSVSIMQSASQIDKILTFNAPVTVQGDFNA